MDQLVNGIVHGQPVEVIEIEQHQVCLEARGDLTDFVSHAEGTSAACCGQCSHFAGTQPVVVVMAA